MNTTCLRTLTLALLLLGAAAGARTEEPAKQKTRAVNLVRDVAASPIDLWQAVDRAEKSGGVALRAAFAHDPGGQLTLCVLLRAPKEEPPAYEEWCGPVYEGCWVPRRRTSLAEAERAEARRLDAVMAAATRSLRRAITSSRGPQRADKTWPGLALSIEPVLREGTAQATSLVAHDGRIQRVTHTIDTGVILSSRAAPAPAGHTAADGDPTASRLPKLEVEGGAWFHAQTPPTLTSLRGHPVLVSIADPG